MARELPQDLVSRRRGEKSRKRVRLSQARRSIVAPYEHTQNAANRPPQLLLPLQKVCLDSGIRGREPTLQGSLRPWNPRGIFRQPSRDGFTERTTAFVDEPMILHTGVKLATPPNSGEAISNLLAVMDVAIQESNYVASHAFAALFPLGPAKPRRVSSLIGPSAGGRILCDTGGRG
jgi:hypothetical protein